MRWFVALIGLAVAVGPTFVQGQQKTDPARTLFNTGRDLWDDGKYTDAEKSFREALAKYPKSDQADRTAYYLITTLTKLGRVRDAVAEISKFEKRYPQSKWMGDVREKYVSLTNLVPANLEYTLIPPAPPRPPRPPSPPASPQSPPPPPPPPATPFSFNIKEYLTQSGQSVIGPFGFDKSILSTDPEVSLQQEILRVMLRNDPDRGIDVATERLKADPSDPVVLSNLNTIATSKSAKAMPFLLMLARSGASPKTRQQAIFALERSGTDIPNRLALFEEMYKNSSDNADIRRSIASSLSRISDPQSIPLLSNIAKNDPDVTIRRTAVQSLGRRKEPEALKALEDLLKPRP
jgi:tetratricopeptide (TPR) repeat protein